MDLQVIEPTPGEVRCILPARPPRLGLYVLAFGILGPVIMIAFFLLMSPVSLDTFGFEYVVLAPALLFALVVGGLGLWMAAGRVEVVIGSGVLRTVSRLGPLKWSSSLPLGGIRRFQIGEITPRAGAGSSFLGGIPSDLAMLFADVAGRQRVALAALYPRDLLQRLADELSRRYEVLCPDPPPASARREGEAEQKAASNTLPAKETASPEQPADGLPIVPAEGSTGKPTRLRYQLASADHHPGWTLAFLFFFMLVWCGISSFWGYGVVRSHLQGSPVWEMAPVNPQRILWAQTIFFIPFVLGGVMLVGAFLRQLYVTLGHKRARVEVSAQPLHPGEKFDVFLSLSGPLKLKGLRVLLVCQEEASYGEGTNVRTETRRVVEEEVVRRDAFAIARHFPYEVQRVVQVPAGAMHSFEAKHNKVRWLVIISGEAAGWSNLEHSFPVIVYPAPADRGQV
jgi:hypothetical protein